MCQQTPPSWRGTAVAGYDTFMYPSPLRTQTSPSHLPNLLAFLTLQFQLGQSPLAKTVLGWHVQH